MKIKALVQLLYQVEKRKKISAEFKPIQNYNTLID